jgi:hypothetical protein
MRVIVNGDVIGAHGSHTAAVRRRLPTPKRRMRKDEVRYLGYRRPPAKPAADRSPLPRLTASSSSRMDGPSTSVHEREKGSLSARGCLRRRRRGGGRGRDGEAGLRPHRRPDSPVPRHFRPLPRSGGAQVRARLAAALPERHRQLQHQSPSTRTREEAAGMPSTHVHNKACTCKPIPPWIVVSTQPSSPSASRWRSSTAPSSRGKHGTGHGWAPASRAVPKNVSGEGRGIPCRSVRQAGQATVFGEQKLLVGGQMLALLFRQARAPGERLRVTGRDTTMAANQQSHKLTRTTTGNSPQENRQRSQTIPPPHTYTHARDHHPQRVRTHAQPLEVSGGLRGAQERSMARPQTSSAVSLPVF